MNKLKLVKRFLTFKYFKFDLLGGITAGIVALPLALAFGEQSGLGAASGLYGAAFIAFFAALFGGTATQISGPTAPMTALSMTIVAGLVLAYEGNIELALPVILMVFLLSGLLQIVLGVLKLGTYVKYIPYTVVSGFMSGIGVIILITQVPPMLGYYAENDQEVIDKFKPHAEEMIVERILKEEEKDGILVVHEFNKTIDRVQAITDEQIAEEAVTLAKNNGRGVYGSIRYFTKAITNISLLELLLCLITIAIIYLFPKITKAIPSALVALLLVSGGAYFLELEYMPISKIPEGLPVFNSQIFTEFDFANLLPFLLPALLLALLGSIDSLLTSIVADNLTRTQHDSNRELIGQGIGNGVAALFGGLPGAGATIRTVVNINAGGKTKLSGMIAGLLLVTIILLLGPIASKIPKAVLAGILITVGIGVMDYKGLKAFPKMDFTEKAILATVLILTVFWQLVYAVGIGLIMAAFVFMKKMADLHNDQVEVKNMTAIEGSEPLWKDEVTIPEEILEKVMFKHLNGPMFFGIVGNLRGSVANLPDIHLLVIRLENVPFMDQSAAYALESAIEDLHDKDVIVALSGPNEEVLGLMIDVGIVPNLVSQRHVFNDFSGCRNWLREVLEKENGLEEELKLLKEHKDKVFFVK